MSSNYSLILQCRADCAAALAMYLEEDYSWYIEKIAAAVAVPLPYNAWALGAIFLEYEMRKVARYIAYDICAEGCYKDLETYPLVLDLDGDVWSLLGVTGKTAPRYKLAVK